MTAIIGPNGAGKSTLLKACLGIVPRLSGEVELFGQPLEKARHRIAYVPQRASVDWDFPATVLDLVKMGLFRSVGLFRTAQGRARGTRTGLSGAGRHGRFRGSPDRAAVRRPAAARVPRAGLGAGVPNLYLLDEPFAGVDAATERAIVDVLRTLKSEGKTVIAVHHDLATVTE